MSEGTICNSSLVNDGLGSHSNNIKRVGLVIRHYAINRKSPNSISDLLHGVFHRLLPHQGNKDVLLLFITLRIAGNRSTHFLDRFLLF